MYTYQILFNVKSKTILQEKMFLQSPVYSNYLEVLHSADSICVQAILVLQVRVN